jgi:hypothetical protein
MTEEIPKWKRFEKRAFEIQKSISAANTDVKLNDHIIGESGANRQVDISIRSRVGSYPILVVVECKYHKTPVDVAHVGGFIGKMRDVRANKGVIISASGFTKAAINEAGKNDVDLRRLIDTESVEWGSDVSVPCLLERVFMDTCSLRFEDFIELPIEHKKLLALELETEGGEKLGTITSILRRKWDSHEIPHAPGMHEVVIGRKLYNDSSGIKQAGGVVASVVVKQAYYSGLVPIHFAGLLNVKSGGIVTRQLLTGTISPIDIEMGRVSSWKQIGDPSSLSAPPAFHIGYSDVYFPDRKWAEVATIWPKKEH